jgi:DNA-binding Xre family transcriptional regulator
MSEPRIVVDPKKVKIALAVSGLDQNEAAKKAGISFTTLSRLKGSDNWQPKTLAALAAALDIHPYDLLTAEGFPDPKPGSPGNGHKQDTDD